MNEKNYISRQCTSILKGWYNVCLVTVIGLEMLTNWPWGEEIFISFSPHESKPRCIFESFCTRN